MAEQQWSTEFRGLADKPFELLMRIEHALGATAEAITTQQRTWSGLAIRVGGMDIVVPRDDVQEVIRTPRLTRVPGGAPWLLGVANVRGGLLPIVDAAAFYGLSDQMLARSDTAANVVVVNSEAVQAGLRVDSVLGYREFQIGEQRSELVDASSPELRPDLIGAFVQNGSQWLALSLKHLVLSERYGNASTDHEAHAPDSGT